MRRALAITGVVVVAFAILFALMFVGVVNLVERVIGVLVGARRG